MLSLSPISEEGTVTETHSRAEPEIALPSVSVNKLVLGNTVNAHIGPTFVAENLHIHTDLPQRTQAGTTNQKPNEIVPLVSHHRRWKNLALCGILAAMVATSVLLPLTVYDDILTSDVARNPFVPIDIFWLEPYTDEQLKEILYDDDILQKLSSFPPESVRIYGDQEDENVARGIMQIFFDFDEDGASRLSKSEQRNKLFDIFKKEPAGLYYWNVPLAELEHEKRVVSKEKYTVVLADRSSWNLACWLPQPGDWDYNEEDRGWALLSLEPERKFDHYIFARIGYSLEALKIGQSPSQERARPLWYIVNGTQITKQIIRFPLAAALDPRNGYVRDEPTTSTTYHYLQVCMRTFIVY